ncbi:hypothetical protein [Corynebacterium kefirresidentii]|nr:hypothetical protein [Corynebacterium kefirresidentii]
MKTKKAKRNNAAVIALARRRLKFFTMLRNGEPYHVFSIIQEAAAA